MKRWAILVGILAVFAAAYSTVVIEPQGKGKGTLRDRVKQKLDAKDQKSRGPSVQGKQGKGHIKAKGLGHAKHGDMVRVALDARGSRTFSDWLRQSGVDKDLNSRNKFTVLAPSDAAISKLSKSRRDELRKNKDKMRNFVKAHIVPEALTVRDFQRRQTRKNFLGRNLIVKTGFSINHDKRPSVRDVRVGNAIVHIMDRTLVP